MLMNLKTLQWEEDMLNIFGIPKNSLPKILSSTDNFGTITEGTLKGIPITG
jgi:glycerol kinase